jgi:hypothetical protein
VEIYSDQTWMECTKSSEYAPEYQQEHKEVIDAQKTIPCGSAR